MLMKIELKDDAFDYVRDQLDQGDTYARSLLDLESKGKIYTFLPEKLIDHPIDFSRSVQLSTGIRIYHETEDVVCPVVASFLDHQNKISLIETLSTPISIKHRPEPPAVSLFGQEVYFVLKSYEKLDRIKRAFKGGRDYPFVCGLIDLGNDTNIVLAESQSIQPEWWQLLAQKTQFVIIGAYDAEGFLVWER